VKRVIPFVCAPGDAEAGDWLEALRCAMPDENVALLAALDAPARATCTVAIVANPRPEDLRTLPRLRWVHSVWAGVERLVNDLPDAAFDIVRLVDPRLTDTMAEAVLAWTLFLHRDMPQYARQQAARQWHALAYRSAQDTTVGLLGLGALGEAAAARLVGAGFKVCGWSRHARSLPDVTTYSGLEALPDVLRVSNILVCLLPLTAETRGLLDAAMLAHLPVGASLINFARGPIVDEGALREALDTSHIRHAVLDVFDVEPLPSQRWEWAHPNVTVLPHISAPTDRDTASSIVAAHIRRYREDGTIPPCVDRVRGY
jgi:glyoxylate/hydroxypyruvate reductase A